MSSATDSLIIDRDKFIKFLKACHEKPPAKEKRKGKNDQGDEDDEEEEEEHQEKSVPTALMTTQKKTSKLVAERKVKEALAKDERAKMKTALVSLLGTNMAELCALSGNPITVMAKLGPRENTEDMSRLLKGGFNSVEYFKNIDAVCSIIFQEIIDGLAKDGKTDKVLKMSELHHRFKAAQIASVFVKEYVVNSLPGSPADFAAKQKQLQFNNYMTLYSIKIPVLSYISYMSESVDVYERRIIAPIAKLLKGISNVCGKFKEDKKISLPFSSSSSSSSDQEDGKPEEEEEEEEDVDLSSALGMFITGLERCKTASPGVITRDLDDLIQELNTEKIGAVVTQESIYMNTYGTRTTLSGKINRGVNRAISKIEAMPTRSAETSRIVTMLKSTCSEFKNNMESLVFDSVKIKQEPGAPLLNTKESKVSAWEAKANEFSDPFSGSFKDATLEMKESVSSDDYSMNDKCNEINAGLIAVYNECQIDTILSNVNTQRAFIDMMLAENATNASLLVNATTIHRDARKSFDDENFSFAKKISKLLSYVQSDMDAHSTFFSKASIRLKLMINKATSLIKTKDEVDLSKLDKLDNITRCFNIVFLTSDNENSGDEAMFLSSTNSENMDDSVIKKEDEEEEKENDDDDDFSTEQEDSEDDEEEMNEFDSNENTNRKSILSIYQAAFKVLASTTTKERTRIEARIKMMDETKAAILEIIAKYKNISDDVVFPFVDNYFLGATKYLNFVSVLINTKDRQAAFIAFMKSLQNSSESLKREIKNISSTKDLVSRSTQGAKKKLNALRAFLQNNIEKELKDKISATAKHKTLLRKHAKEIRDDDKHENIDKIFSELGAEEMNSLNFQQMLVTSINARLNQFSNDFDALVDELESITSISLADDQRLTNVLWLLKKIKGTSSYFMEGLFEGRVFERAFETYLGNSKDVIDTDVFNDDEEAHSLNTDDLSDITTLAEKIGRRDGFKNALTEIIKFKSITTFLDMEDNKQPSSDDSKLSDVFRSFIKGTDTKTYEIVISERKELTTCAEQSKTSYTIIKTNAFYNDDTTEENSRTMSAPVLSASLATRLFTFNVYGTNGDYSDNKEFRKQYQNYYLKLAGINTIPSKQTPLKEKDTKTLCTMSASAILTEQALKGIPPLYWISYLDKGDVPITSQEIFMQLHSSVMSRDFEKISTVLDRISEVSIHQSLPYNEFNCMFVVLRAYITLLKVVYTRNRDSKIDILQYNLQGHYVYSSDASNNKKIALMFGHDPYTDTKSGEGILSADVPGNKEANVLFQLWYSMYVKDSSILCNVVENEEFGDAVALSLAENISPGFQSVIKFNEILFSNRKAFFNGHWFNRQFNGLRARRNRDSPPENFLSKIKRIATIQKLAWVSCASTAARMSYIIGNELIGHQTQGESVSYYTKLASMFFLSEFNFSTSSVYGSSSLMKNEMVLSDNTSESYHEIMEAEILQERYRANRVSRLLAHKDTAVTALSRLGPILWTATPDGKQSFSNKQKRASEEAEFMSGFSVSGQVSDTQIDYLENILNNLGPYALKAYTRLLVNVPTDQIRAEQSSASMTLQLLANDCGKNREKEEYFISGAMLSLFKTGKLPSPRIVDVVTSISKNVEYLSSHTFIKYFRMIKQLCSSKFIVEGNELSDVIDDLVALKSQNISQTFNDSHKNYASTLHTLFKIIDRDNSQKNMACIKHFLTDVLVPYTENTVFMDSEISPCFVSNSQLLLLPETKLKLLTCMLLGKFAGGQGIGIWSPHATVTTSNEMKKLVSKTLTLCKSSVGIFHILCKHHIVDMDTEILTTYLQDVAISEGRREAIKENVTGLQYLVSFLSGLKEVEKDDQLKNKKVKDDYIDTLEQQQQQKPLPPPPQERNGKNNKNKGKTNKKSADNFIDEDEEENSDDSFFDGSDGSGYSSSGSSDSEEDDDMDKENRTGGSGGNEEDQILSDERLTEWKKQFDLGVVVKNKDKKPQKKKIDNILDHHSTKTLVTTAAFIKLILLDTKDVNDYTFRKRDATVAEITSGIEGGESSGSKRKDRENGDDKGKVSKYKMSDEIEEDDADGEEKPTKKAKMDSTEGKDKKKKKEKKPADPIDITPGNSNDDEFLARESEKKKKRIADAELRLQKEREELRIANEKKKAETDKHHIEIVKYTRGVFKVILDIMESYIAARNLGMSDIPVSEIDLKVVLSNKVIPSDHMKNYRMSYIDGVLKTVLLMHFKPADRDGDDVYERGELLGDDDGDEDEDEENGEEDDDEDEDVNYDTLQFSSVDNAKFIDSSYISSVRPTSRKIDSSHYERFILLTTQTRNINDPSMLKKKRELMLAQKETSRKIGDLRLKSSSVTKRINNLKKEPIVLSGNSEEDRDAKRSIDREIRDLEFYRVQVLTEMENYEQKLKELKWIPTLEQVVQYNLKQQEQIEEKNALNRKPKVILSEAEKKERAETIAERKRAKEEREKAKAADKIAQQQSVSMSVFGEEDYNEEDDDDFDPDAEESESSNNSDSDDDSDSDESDD